MHRFLCAFVLIRFPVLLNILHFLETSPMRVLPLLTMLLT